MSAIETPTLASETIAHIGAFEVRNTLIMAWLAMLVIFAVAFFARRTKYKEIPGRFQSFLELIVEGLFNFFQSVIGDKKQTRTFFPL
ncbi:MAG: F0F1 ATP synthase subunit A, partial [Candidatus Peribacteraceae bacterium]|nr:F0F1 ATP synthase subunit A [Candidatus Peribacteraceae bacterium]